MIKKIYITLIILLLILLPIINSSLLELFGIRLGLNVNGNYEFTKVMFFNIFSSLILILFSINILKNKKKIYIHNFIYYVFITFILGTYFSISPYISLFGNSTKAHSFIMFTNLIGLYILFINLKKEEIKYILKYSIIGLVISSIIAIWQLYFPSFNYGNLSNRALGTFGHPNYLALYILLYIPLLYNNKIKLNSTNQSILLTLILITLFLTKSLIAIFIAFTYTIYFLISKLNNKNKKIFLFLISLFFLTAIFFIFYNFGFTKLHSLFSRLFIWETSIGLSLESLKTILIGHGLETLNLIFDKNKSPFLYIFENIGFSADRSHNIFLYFFYSLGLLGLSIIILIIKYIIQSKSSAYKHSLILAFIFLLFNFASIVSYLIIILLLSLIYKKNKAIKYYEINIFFIVLITIISIYGAYNSFNFYKAENLIKYGKIKNITQVYKYLPDYYLKNGKLDEGLKYSKIKNELYYKAKIYFGNNLNEGCIELTNNYPSVENHFFCGDIYWGLNKKDIAKTYYNIGLKKLPDLWNKNSKYYKNIFIKDTINGNRFFSPKYSNLLEILKRVGIKK